MKLSPHDVLAIRRFADAALTKRYFFAFSDNAQFLLKNQIIQMLVTSIEAGYNHVNGDREVPYTIHHVEIFPKKVKLRWVMGQARKGVAATRFTREDVRNNPKFLSTFFEPSGNLALELDKLEKMKQYL